MTSTAGIALLQRRVLKVFLVVLLPFHGSSNSVLTLNAAAPTNNNVMNNNNSNNKIILWNSGTCPYAQRAWIALLEKQVEFEHRIVDLANKPADFVAKYAAAVGATDVTSVRAKVPLLEHHHGENDNDTVLVVESEDVIKYIGENMGTNDDMYPKDKDSERRVRIESFIQAFEKAIQGYYQFMTATNPEQVDAGKLAFCHALHALAPLLMIPGETTGPFCLGETFSVAECYAAPWIHRYRITVPYFRGVSMREVLLQQQANKGDGDGEGDDDDDHVDRDTVESIENKVTAWMDAVWNRPSVQATNGPDEKLLSATRDYFVKYVTPNSPAAAAAAAAALKE